MDQLLEQHQVHRAEVLVALEFPLDATVTRLPGDVEVVHLKIHEFRKRFDRSCGSDEDPGKLGVSCSSRGGDVVPVDTINIKFRDYADEFTDRGLVWVRGGDEATAHLTLYPQRIASAGHKPSEVLAEALMQIIEQLILPFGRT
ncbi:MAG TPA: hypothetical protein VNU25_03455 [Candidatus Paceibacterota bacterium]|nr:hypothetical protein [Candidatus Paceibacterota bacterium]